MTMRLSSLFQLRRIAVVLDEDVEAIGTFEEEEVTVVIVPSGEAAVLPCSPTALP